MKNKVFRIGFLILAMFLLPAFLIDGSFAGENRLPGDAGDPEHLESLMNRLTETATRTFLNADYVPGMVTVFHGADLIKRGIRYAGEVLDLVPGMHLSHASGIYWKTVVRGVPGPYSSGYVKVLLNGNPLTTTWGIDLIPNIPIEQVDRVEVIRGPGSALYGECAVAGVMNIVTRKTGRSVYGSIGSFQTRHAGAGISGKIPGTHGRFSIDVSVGESQGADLDVGSGSIAVSAPSEGDQNGSETMPPPGTPEIDDSQFDGTGSASPAEENHREFASALFSLDILGATLDAEYLSHDRDFWYRSRLAGFSLNRDFELLPNLRMRGDVSWLRRSYDSAFKDFGSFPDYSCQDGQDSGIYNYDYREKQIRGGIDLTWYPTKHHSVFSRIIYSESSLKDLGQSSVTLFQFQKEKRTSLAILFQDDWRVSERLHMVFRGRYDTFNDVDDQFSPAVSAAFRLNEKRSAPRRHILKFQAARSFRPPTFYETRISDDQNGSESPLIDTLEIGYVTRKYSEVGRLTLFYSRLKKVSYLLSVGSGEYRIGGAELEYSRPLIPGWIEFSGNLSFVDAREKETHENIPGSARWIANADLLFHPVHWLSLSLKLHSLMGKIEGTGASGMDDDHVLDVLTTFHFPVLKGMTFRVGMKNLFREDIRTSLCSSDNKWSFPGDDKPGRFFWVGMTCPF